MPKPARSRTREITPIESFRRDGELIIRADLVNVDFNRITVEQAQDALIIVGRQEYVDNDGDEPNEGLFDSFWQVVPLPGDAIAATATASFRERVLEITVQTVPT